MDIGQGCFLKSQLSCAIEFVISCQIDKTYLGLLYSYLDVGKCIFLMLTIIWIWFFEVRSILVVFLLQKKTILI